MNVGDLVEIESWCKHKFRKAIVVEAPKHLNVVKISFTDTAEISRALTLSHIHI